MNDRLGDIPGWALGDDDDENEAPADGKKEGGGDIEMGETNTQPKHMEHFFREVETIKQDIEAVQKASKQISEFNEAALQATTTEDENAISRKLRPLVDETNKRAKRTKTLLGLLKEENKKLQDQGKVKPTDLRYVTLDPSFNHKPYQPASD
jgi:t-SNARE complex subunit (syntaxin)